MTDPRMNNLISALLEGDCARSVSEAEALHHSGVSPESVVTEGIEPAMTALDSKCTLEQFNLLEIMLAGRAVTEVMKVLFPAGITQDITKGTVVVATLEGDVHDLGKNILKMVLTGKGYHVVDCGKDCSLKKLTDAAVSERPLAVAVSGLITPVIPQVRQVKDQMLMQGLGSVRVVAGGAALKQSSSARLNVDFVAESAFDILYYLDENSGPER